MQKSIYKRLLVINLLIVVVYFSSCSDIIEKNLENEKVELLAPGNGLVTTITSFQFIWNEVDGALEYSIQIAVPDFIQVEQILLDSVVTNKKINYSLSPGSYEWRVKAINGSSETDYSTFILHIDSTANLSGMPLVLISPPNLGVTGSPEIEFRWEAISIAEGYRLEVTNNGGLNEVILDQTYPSSINVVELPEGIFNWKAHAFNATPSVSNWSESRTLTVDLTPPSTPLLTYPSVSDSLSFNSSFTYMYQSGIDALTSTYDSLFVSSNLLFISPIRQVKIEDGQQFTDSLGIGTYFWKVKTIDEAGNGTSSPTNSFHIQ